jgi:hypothetical protein
MNALKSRHCEDPALDAGDVAIRRSRREGVARGNLKSSLALLGTRLHFVRNDTYEAHLYLSHSDQAQVGA